MQPKNFFIKLNNQFHDYPMVSIKTAVYCSEVAYVTEASPNPKRDLDAHDKITDKWLSEDKVVTLLGMFSSSRLYTY